MPDYSAERFYVDATDKRGHSQKIQVTVPPMIHSMIGELIAKKVVADYRTFADFARDAIVHRLHYLNNEYTPTFDVTNDLAVLRATEELETFSRRGKAYESLVEMYKAEMANADLPQRVILREAITRDLETISLPSDIRHQLERLL